MNLIAALTDTLREAMLAHAQEEAPRECCGLLVRLPDGEGLSYYRAENQYIGTAGEDRFQLDPDAFVYLEDLGAEVLAVVHSHPNGSANPSMADRVGCERSGLPWLIVGWPSGVFKQLAPSGWAAPYEGRTFHHGVLDCYTLLQDWYRREPDLGFELPDIDRDDDWWKPKLDGQGCIVEPAQDLYMQHFAAAGFVRVQGQPQRHDVILMQVKSDRANHGAIYLGDGTMLHHLAGRLSERTVYGGYWLQHTMALLRHHSRVSA